MFTGDSPLTAVGVPPGLPGLLEVLGDPRGRRSERRRRGVRR